MTAKHRTRGPRTPHEKAGDASRSTATLFEKLPSSHYADAVLKPLAVLLRFDHSGRYLEPGGFEEASRAYLAVVDYWKLLASSATAQRIKREEERLDTVRGDIDTLQAILATQLAKHQAKPSLSLVPTPDDG